MPKISYFPIIRTINTGRVPVLEDEMTGLTVKTLLPGLDANKAPPVEYLLPSKPFTPIHKK